MNAQVNSQSNERHHLVLGEVSQRCPLIFRPSFGFFFPEFPSFNYVLQIQTSGIAEFECLSIAAKVEFS